MAAVTIMEDHGAFNAGFGSVLNAEGCVQMDASVMDGSCLKYGAVAGISKAIQKAVCHLRATFINSSCWMFLITGNIRNPVQVARRVADTRHCILCGDGAFKFALENGFARASEEDLVSSYARRALERSFTLSVRMLLSLCLMLVLYEMAG